MTTIDEINNANPGSKLRLEDLVEGTKPNTHWKSLLNLANGTGKLVKELSEDDRIYYMNYLCRKIKIMEDGKVKVVQEDDEVDDDDEESQYFISYVARNRIEVKHNIGSGRASSILELAEMEVGDHLAGAELQPGDLPARHTTHAYYEEIQ